MNLKFSNLILYHFLQHSWEHIKCTQDDKKWTFSIPHHLLVTLFCIVLDACKMMVFKLTIFLMTSCWGKCVIRDYTLLFLQIFEDFCFSGHLFGYHSFETIILLVNFYRKICRNLPLLFTISCRNKNNYLYSSN